MCLQGGGTYLTSGSINLTTSNNHYNLNRFLTISSNTITCVNKVDYSFSNRTLTLEFTTIANGRPRIFINFHPNSLGNTSGLKTSIFYITNVDSPDIECCFEGYRGWTDVWYYRNRKTVSKNNSTIVVSVAKYHGGSSESIQIQSSSGDIPTGIHFKYIIENIALYEGAYTNPPFCKSLAQLNNEGFINDYSRSTNYYNVRPESLGHWIRLCPLCIGTVHTAGHIHLVKDYTPYYDASLLIQFHANNSGGSDGTTFGYLKILSAISRNGSSWKTEIVSKLRIGYPSSARQYVFLEGYVVNHSHMSTGTSFCSAFFRDVNYYYNINYLAGLQSYNINYSTIVNNYLGKIADSDTAASGSGEIDTPSTNGFVL